MKRTRKAKLLIGVLMLFAVTSLNLPRGQSATDACSTCQSSCWSQSQDVYNTCVSDSWKVYDSCMAPWPGPGAYPDTLPNKPTVCENWRNDALSACPQKQVDAYNNCLSVFCNYGLGCRIPKAPYSSPGSN